MKIQRLPILVLAMALCLPFLSAQAEEASTPVISAQSAVVLTADTGLVLYARDKDTPRPVASTTKILTALLALEAAEETDDPLVEIPQEAAGVEGSSMGLKAGDRVSLSNLAAGMMMASGNDAALAAALFLDGSEEAFARRMNQRARELGMARSHFVTASGLDADGHQSTAYDMALLARAALENPDFARLAATPSWPVEFVQPAHTVQYHNHNKLLAQVEGCIGVKTGYTRLAGRCLVSAAERQGVRLIVVTLNDPDDWKDHAALLEYGFSQVEPVTFTAPAGLRVAAAGGESLSLPVEPPAPVTLTLPRDQKADLTTRVLLPRFVYGPLQPGDRVGWLQVELAGSTVFRLPLRAEEALAGPAEEPGFWEQLFSSWNS